MKRLILYASGNGVSLFFSTSIDDEGCFADEWYESLDDAYAACRSRFGIDERMWRDVPDPEPGCQEDWIAPVRVRGRIEGRPEWGVLERHSGLALGLAGMFITGGGTFATFGFSTLTARDSNDAISP